MSPESDWRPSASLSVLRLRARLLAEIRRFFDDRGFFEVDTPLLSRERVVDPHLEPFVVGPLYLQTSPEFCMKRLLAAGAEAIYQVGHVFRRGERGRLHNPEFTMIEWYRAGSSYREQMQTTEELVIALCHAGVAADDFPSSRIPASSSAATGTRPLPAAPFGRTSYREAFRTHAGADVMTMDLGQLQEWAHVQGLTPPPWLAGCGRDDWLTWLLPERVEPQLGRERPEFLYDYPASQAALAQVRPGNPALAERFELYWQGIELCNGYHELTDESELERRIAAESARRGKAGLPALSLPERLLAAMKSGLPACAGVALGFDRLLMLIAGARTIDEVISFSFERA